ncbi:MAG: tyrosine-type recombinase/integrase [Lachnospiraceae bacterium]|nr:tyrosine-type recombinase/integrase [Lachnospiraceae bacterium]
MKYKNSILFKDELQNISDVLELINYRQRTIDSYLQCIFEFCKWLQETYGIQISDAGVIHFRAFLLHLKRSKEDGGLGYAPRSVNIYNCALKKYSRFVLRKPLSNDDLPLCKVDHPLPKVPSQKDVFTFILGMENLKHMAEMAVAYGAALRISEVASLRFRDISFSEGTITVSAEASKNRYTGKIELSRRLKGILYKYWKECCPNAKPDDYLFPGQKPGTHITKSSLGRVFKKRIEELGWESRGYSFHSLRHGAALHYYQAGADLFQVQQRLRHRSITSTLIYVQLDAKLQERRHIENPFDAENFS